MSSTFLCIFLSDFGCAALQGYDVFATRHGRYLGFLEVGCTGAPYGENWILTASHCFEGGVSGSFFLHYHNGEYQTETEGLTHVNSLVGHTKEGDEVKKELRTGRDWALISLSGKKMWKHGAIGGNYGKPNAQTKLVYYGYGDREDGKRVAWGCDEIRWKDDYRTQFFHHDCPGAPGHSGSAIAVKGEGKAIGIHVGFLTERKKATTGIANLALNIQDAFAKVRTNVKESVIIGYRDTQVLEVQKTPTGNKQVYKTVRVPVYGFR